ncbi:hypothetical protein NS274_07810 [Pseudomonas oryzihabitans]|nr:hypothetical protein NS274_07810 [Pseudomonas psychrotolerans]
MSESHIDEAVNLLDYYLDDAVRTDYAIMLSAPWGAGKTHFIKNYLDGCSAHVGEEDGPYYLYVSLYGITTVAQIRDQFFAQSHPQLGSKNFQLFGSMASGALEKFLGVKGAGEALKDGLLNLNGKIIVFDDLERCSMKISDVLGFINSLVEHENLKVIILANEKEIPTAQLDEYSRQKEKLVGKTVEVRANPTDVLDKLVGEMKLGPARDVVLLQKADLLAAFSASKKPNYRNLRAILADFERLVGVVETRLGGAPEALKELLLYMIATGCETRSAELGEAMFRQLPTSNYSLNRLFSKAEKTAEEVTYGKLVDRYPMVCWTDPIISPKHLADLFFSGKISVGLINAELAVHPKVVGHAQIPAWRLLWDWSNLTKSEYSKIKDELLDELANEKITLPGLILHVAGIAITLRTFGEELISSERDLLKFFTEYVSNLVKADRLAQQKIMHGVDSMSYGGLAYSSRDTSEFASINAMVKDASAEVLRRHLKAKADGYVARLGAGAENYSSLYEYGVDEENYGGMPFLQHVNVANFANLLISDSLVNTQLFASLVKRYEGSRHNGHPLLDEYLWIQSLKEKLFAIADSDSPPFSKAIRGRLEYYFERIWEEIGAPEKES